MTLAPARPPSTSMPVAPGQATSAPTIERADPGMVPSALDTLRTGHLALDAHRGDACSQSSPAPAIVVAPTKSGALGRGQQDVSDHSRRDNHRDAVADALLLILADALDDLEGVRKATASRLLALVDIKGLPDGPEAQRLAAMLKGIKQLEHDAELDLKRALRKHPLGPWVKRTTGLGEKQAARLIAAIGDPLWNHAEDRPRRGPAELWAYCGYHVVNGQRPRRAKGVKSNWNATAKMRAHLCAESCMKQRTSPYRAVYDRERAKWATRDTTDMHKHNHALSVVAKEILRDLWRESLSLAHTPSDTQGPRGEGFFKEHA